VKFGQYELPLAKGFHKELFKLYFETIQIKVLDRESTTVDDLYGETKSRVYKEPVEIDAFVVRNPPLKFLSKYGIDEQRDLLITFSQLLLEEKKLTVSIGDRVILKEGDEYEILTFGPDRGDFFGNTGEFIQFVATAKRVTENAS